MRTPGPPTPEDVRSGTISNPPLNLAIESVSKIVLKHLTSSYTYCIEETPFDIDNFLRKEFQVNSIPRFNSVGPTIFTQVRKKSKTKLPDYEHIKKFLFLIFQKLKLGVECGIVALIYIERLMNIKGIPLTTRNWRPILIASILTASKVWDDLATWNLEFAEMFPVIGLKEINNLEKCFLTALDYNFFISGPEYAKYYFALRAVRQKAQNVPRLYRDLKIGVPRLLDDQMKNTNLNDRPRDFHSTAPSESSPVQENSKSIQIQSSQRQMKLPNIGMASSLPERLG